MSSVSFLLNGQPVTVESARPEKTLLDCLRERGLTGAKEGCAEGECGACTVAMVVGDNGRSAYRPVNSCLFFVHAAQDREFVTVEGLADAGTLAPAQDAMAAAGGSQCGYCTPGFVMSLFTEQYRPGRVGPCDPLALAGNLCRCTGYRPIRDAALSLGPPPPGRLLDRLSAPAPALHAASTATFARPRTVEDAVACLTGQTGAKLLAGGTDIGVEANLQSKRSPGFVSLEAIDELQQLSDQHERVRIGAGLPLTDIAASWRDAPDAWREWTSLFASPPIRNRATLGGNLATASPIGDSAPLLLALDASVEIAGASRRRTVPLAEFFTGYRKTVLSANEVLVAIDIPKPLPRLLGFYKIAKRRLDDISTVAAAMALDTDDAGRVVRARVAYGGVAATPVRVLEAEKALMGQVFSELAAGRAATIVTRTLDPLSDHRGSREYRLRMAASLIAKFRWECAR